MKSNYLFLVAILSLLIILGSADSAHSDQLDLDIDWAMFRYDDTHVMLEIYYAFLQDDIRYQFANDSYIGTTFGELRIYQDEHFLEQYSWKNQNIVPDSLQLKNLKLIIDRVAFKLASGEYECEFTLQDVNDSTNFQKVKWPLNIPPMNQSTPYISDIEIASSITQVSQATDSPFYKNTLNVVPNPTLIFSSELPMLFFYMEAYHLDKAGLTDGYSLTYSIRNSDGEVLESPRPRRFAKRDILNPSIEFGMMNVGRLKSGAYRLDVSLLKPDESIIDEKSKKFYIYQRDEELITAANDTVAQSSTGIFASMDSLTIVNEYNIANYLMTDEFRVIWNSLDTVEGRKRFLFQFWNMRDPNPDTPTNEFRDEYYKRVDYANRHYRAFTKEGWSTDRGRVYIIYGPPSDIERHPNEPNLYPYEIWEYDHLQSGVIFVFGDFEGYKNYRLLHSNLDGEIKDYYYIESLRKGY
ncbi:GWxTD domain-containing protein [candidate division KSB1 bacterium]|nr:GWxTD domain-containing protein [candidate division KSB1 bacterium]